jgi:hypothetical protein
VIGQRADQLKRLNLLPAGQCPRVSTKYATPLNSSAWAAYRALLARRNAVDWYEFESKATERALRNWCELNSITVIIID